MSRKLSRRSFIGQSAGLCAIGAWTMRTSGGFDDGLPPRKRLPNPFVENGKPIVVVVHGTSYPEMAAKGMELLGGFKPFGTGHAVHVKPNYVAPSPYPVTTPDTTVLTTIEMLQKEGFSDISVAEWASSWNVVRKTAAFSYYGLPEKAERGGFKCDDFYDNGAKSVQDLRWRAVPRVGVIDACYQIPFIVNMPTLKQHDYVQFTCALKNTMGQIDALTRRIMHRRDEPYSNDDAETRLLMSRLSVAEIASAVNPELTIIDARQALGKSHHLNRGGVLVEPNRVIISGNALAADVVAAEVLAQYYEGFEVAMAQPTFDHAAALGMGPATRDGLVVKEITT